MAMTPKTRSLGGSPGRPRPPLSRVKMAIDAPGKIQKANASSVLPTAPNAIAVTPKKAPLHKAVAGMMLAGGKNG